MNPKTIIETVGRIIKLETLVSIDHNIMSNTLVLENNEPFPGYFGHNLPKDTAPRSIFIVLDKKYKEIKLKRIIKSMKKEDIQACDMISGSIKIYTNKYYCLRINNLSCFDQIPRIQSMLKDHGIKFTKAKKIHDKGKIILNKYFIMEEASPGLFKNLAQTEQYFIAIPRKIKWKQFYDITMKIKQNIDNKMFDAAMGFMLRENTIIDFVRIFDKDQSPERMKKIQEMYLHEVDRL